MRTQSRGFILILTLLMMTLFALLGNIQIAASLQASLRLKNALTQSQLEQMAATAASQGKSWLNNNINASSATPCAVGAGSCATYWASNLSAASSNIDPTSTAWSGWVGGAKARSANLGTAPKLIFPKLPNALAYFNIELISQKQEGDGNYWPTYRVTGYAQGDASNTASKTTVTSNYTPPNPLTWTKTPLAGLNSGAQFNTSGRNTLNVFFQAIKDDEAGSLVDNSGNCVLLRQDSANNSSGPSDYADIPMNSQWMFINNYNNNLWASQRLNHPPGDERLRAGNASCPDSIQNELNGQNYSGIAAFCQVDAKGRVRVGVYSNYDVYNNSNNYGGNYSNSENGPTANNYHSQHNPVCGWYYGPWAGPSQGSVSTIEIPTGFTEQTFAGNCSYTSRCPDPNNTSSYNCCSRTGCYANQNTDASYCCGYTNTKPSCDVDDPGNYSGCHWCCTKSGTNCSNLQSCTPNCNSTSRADNCPDTNARLCTNNCANGSGSYPWCPTYNSNNGCSDGNNICGGSASRQGGTPTDYQGKALKVYQENRILNKGNPSNPGGAGCYDLTLGGTVSGPAYIAACTNYNSTLGSCYTTPCNYPGTCCSDGNGTRTVYDCQMCDSGCTQSISTYNQNDYYNNSQCSAYQNTKNNPNNYQHPGQNSSFNCTTSPGTYNTTYTFKCTIKDVSKFTAP